MTCHTVSQLGGGVMPANPSLAAVATIESIPRLLPHSVARFRGGQRRQLNSGEHGAALIKARFDLPKGRRNDDRTEITIGASGDQDKHQRTIR